MYRRTFITAFSVFLASGQVASAQQDPLRNAFEALGSEARKAAQSQLSFAGLYTGSIDGVYGPATRAALSNAANFIKDNSYGRIRFDLTSVDGAKKFVVALARGELSAYLWGEGDENDAG